MLLVNLGTPDNPTPSSVRKYLRDFLSDRRVVDWPRWLWLPILHLMVLTFRPRLSAGLYKSIWRQDSPLRIYMHELESSLAKSMGGKVPVRSAMRHGSPSIHTGLSELQRQGCSEARVIPLFPQFSHSQTLSISDELERLRGTFPDLGLELVHSFGTHEAYIGALEPLLREALERHPGAHLVLSFHGLPQSQVDKGDSYLEECRHTSLILSRRLGHSDWSLSFQSRFGPARWLEPDLLDTLAALGHAGRDVVVATPGFFCDCLETLEELDVRAKGFFKSCGGGSWERVSCLNASPEAITLLATLSTS